jgi:hypothetical protein
MKTTTTTTIENLTCECGTHFQWDHAGDDWNLRHCRPKHCEPCQVLVDAENERIHEETLERAAAKKLAEAQESTAQRILEWTPPRYQRTDINHPAFNGALWRKAKSWKPTDDVPFLGLIGDSGACKTRIAFMLFRDIALGLVNSYETTNGSIYIPRFCAMTSPDFAQLVGKQFLNHSGPRGSWDADPKQEARRQLDKLRDCDVLLLDDLGKAKNTPSVAAELFAIIDHRHNHDLATIWTANSTPEEIVNGMSEDMAGPLAGRLIECSKIFTFK